MLIIGMMVFTGFGFTTSDPDQNSTTEAFQGDDLKVSTVDLVIVAPVVFQDLHVRCDKASINTPLQHKSLRKNGSIFCDPMSGCFSKGRDAQSTNPN